MSGDWPNALRARYAIAPISSLRILAAFRFWAANSFLHGYAPARDMRCAPARDTELGFGGWPAAVILP